MARMPVRSALMLMYILLIKISLVISSESKQTTATVSTPKFGDRILPRNKQLISAEDRSAQVIVNSGRISTSRVMTNNDNSASATTNVLLNVTKVNEQSPSRPITFGPINKNSDAADGVAIDEHEKRFIQRSSYDGVTDNSDEKKTLDIQAYRLEMSTEYFLVPSYQTPVPAKVRSRSTTIRSNGVILAASTTPRPLGVENISRNYSSSHHGYTGLRNDPWVFPVLVLSSLSMIVMVAFEVFVIFKAWRTSPSQRHLFLGQMLLLGLFACSGLAAVFTLTPSLLSCATVRFGTGVAFALIFASLLVKCVFLMSLNGGVYLPAPYQGLLLLFAVLIQVAVGAQWLITSPPAITTMSVLMGENSIVSSKYSLVFQAADITILNSSIQLCKTKFSEFLLSLIYVVFLIFFVSILAIKTRRIRDNYRESSYIGLSIGGTIPIWFGWTVCGLVVGDRDRDACIAFGLIATSITVFLVMFMPKGRQLAAMGKEGFYVEDRDEHFSSLSRTNSGYSPSFFHFKPIKYGVMVEANQTLNTNIPNGTDTLGGSKIHTGHPTLGPGGLFMRTDENNVLSTLEQTMSSNPNVYFQRGMHPGMMY